MAENIYTGVTKPIENLTEAELLAAMGWDVADTEMNDLMGGAMRQEMLAQGRDIERAFRKKNNL